MQLQGRGQYPEAEEKPEIKVLECTDEELME